MDFALQGTESSGVTAGVFAGTFSFVVRQTRAGVPDSGNALAMLALAVAGCAGMRKFHNGDLEAGKNRAGIPVRT